MTGRDSVTSWFWLTPVGGCSTSKKARVREHREVADTPLPSSVSCAAQVQNNCCARYKAGQRSVSDFPCAFMQQSGQCCASASIQKGYGDSVLPGLLNSVLRMTEAGDFLLDSTCLVLCPCALLPTHITKALTISSGP